MVDALRSERSELMLVEVQVLSSAPSLYFVLAAGLPVNRAQEWGEDILVFIEVSGLQFLWAGVVRLKLNKGEITDNSQGRTFVAFAHDNYSTAGQATGYIGNTNR